MKLLVLALAFLAFAGCTPAAVRDEVALNAARCERFAAMMDEGRTTRDQEQEFIRANGEAWKGLRDYFSR